MDQEQRLLYIFDPLCGWCYGFSPVMRQVEMEYAGRLPIDVLCGGMLIGNSAGPISEAAAYIRGALPQVTERSGVVFGPAFTDGILGDGGYIQDSEPPCTAMTAFKELAPGRALEIAHDMQRAFFMDGQSLNDPRTYLLLCEKHGIPEDDFLTLLEESATREKTFAEFALVKEFGVTGFPTVLMTHGDDSGFVSRGYTDFTQMKESIDRFL